MSATASDEQLREYFRTFHRVYAAKIDATIDPLVADWIRYHVERRKPTDPLFAAWNEVTDIVTRDPEEGWTVTLALVDAAPDDWVLCNVAAGPLEDLLKKFSDVLIDRAEVQARRDPKFRRCLTGVWGLPPSVYARLRKYTSTVKDPL